MAQLRRLLRAAREHPAITVAAVLVLFGSAIASAAVVVATDDDESSLPPTTTTVSTTAPPTTTAAPTTTTAAPTTTTTPPTTTTAAPTTTRPQGQRCLVRLHGKGGGGQPTYTDGQGVKVLTPNGNADGWGGRQWLYFPNPRYNEARRVVTNAIDDDGCDTVIINGFSNGAAFAAKLYCKGETFGDRVVRYVVDDPVVDEAVLDCEPSPSTSVTLYWTGDLESTAQPGWDCSEEDWTCEGGQTIGIDAYSAALGTGVKQSAFTSHNWYQEAPELSDW
jgi:hypothetical protein